MKVFLLRHGESEYNLRGLCNSDPGVPVALTPAGRRQAEMAAERLRALPIGRIYVSRLQRARETADIVNAHHSAGIRVDARLDDRSTGFEGRPVKQYIHAMHSAPDPFGWKHDGGESYRELVARVHAFVGDLSEPGGAAALVVAHHEVIQAAVGYFRGLGPREMWNIPVDNCEILEFDLNK